MFGKVWLVAKERVSMMHRNTQGIAFEQPQGQEHICTPSVFSSFFEFLRGV
ncbi:hypothetical protein [Pseudomonas promysalinigenes]|uniref:hypothetical protein n=1 Tax=Pseudomonas promysalinigenes TaxID=485898 RepID=UPI0037C8CDE4